jgi:microcystin-dependent protein
MSSQPLLSQIGVFAFGFAPKNWAVCAGQLLAIAQNQALFALLGTTYGGNGQTTFALPDLRGRVPLGFAQGPGLSNYGLGETGGSESAGLISSQLPAHTHAIDTSALTAAARCRNGVANQRTPVGNAPAIEAAGVTATFSNSAPDANMSGAAIAMGGTITAGTAGGGVPHVNTQPLLVLTYCICLNGIFPSQP